MKRLLAMAVGLLLLSACLPLDSQLYPAKKVDHYQLAFQQVPANLVEQVSFQTSDGLTLAGVWAHQDPPMPPIIFFHGFSDNIDSYTDRVDYYWSWHTNDVFIFDYRGYGMSDGTPNNHGVLDIDGVAAVDYVSQATGVAPQDIPWVSLSLGAAIAVHTNSQVQAHSVTLESMFSNEKDVADDSTGLDLPIGWFFADGNVDNVAAIANIQSPVFIIHGLADTFVSPAHDMDIYNAAPDPKELWQPAGVGHSDIITVMPQQYHDRVLAFDQRFPY